MSILMPEQIKEFKPSGRILGLDIGQKTIGLAVSNSMHTLAVPLKTVKRTKYTKDIQSLIPVIREYDITAYVIGWPLHMDGSKSQGCDRAQSFADQMSQDSDIFGKNPNILLWDERLSTEAVKELVDKPVDKIKKSGELDALAAQIILQGVLDSL